MSWRTRMIACRNALYCCRRRMSEETPQATQTKPMPTSPRLSCSCSNALPHTVAAASRKAARDHSRRKGLPVKIGRPGESVQTSGRSACDRSMDERGPLSSLFDARGKDDSSHERWAASTFDESIKVARGRTWIAFVRPERTAGGNKRTYARRIPPSAPAHNSSSVSSSS